MRELRELLMWLDKVYDSNIKEMRDSWLGLVSAMEGGSTGEVSLDTVSLDTMESYKVALLSNQAFRSSGSMFSNSRAGSSPEIHIGRANFFRDKNSSENLEKKVVLAGASIYLSHRHMLHKVMH
jgi:hypothetical protein